MNIFFLWPLITLKLEVFILFYFFIYGIVMTFNSNVCTVLHARCTWYLAPSFVEYTKSYMVPHHLFLKHYLKYKRRVHTLLLFMFVKNYKYLEKKNSGTNTAVSTIIARLNCISQFTLLRSTLYSFNK